MDVTEDDADITEASDDPAATDRPEGEGEVAVELEQDTSADQTSTGEEAAQEAPTEEMETRVLGIPTLDRSLMDGLPAGFTVLVVGNSGSGMELFAKQVASAGEEPTLYFSTEETAKEIRETFQRFDWTKEIFIDDISSRYYKRITEGKLAYGRRRRGEASLSEILDDEEEEEEGEEDFLHMTANRIMDQEEPCRVIVNNLNFFFDEYDQEEVLSVQRALRTYNRHKGGLLLLTLSRGAVDEKLAQRIEANVDVVIELEMDRMSSSFEHRLVVKKVMNHPEKARMFVYGITEEGITPEMVMRVT